MAYVSLQQQQQQFLGKSTATTGGASGNTNGISTGYIPLSQQQQAFIKQAPQPKQQTTSKSLVATAKTPQYKYNGVIPDTARKLLTSATKLPEFHFADTINQYTPQGFGGKLTAFVAGTLQGLGNTPQEAIKSSVNLGKTAAEGKSTPQQVAGDLAAMVQLPSLFFTGGTSSIAKIGLKQTIKNVAASKLKDAGIAVADAAFTGAKFGLLGGIQGGRDITNTQDYLKNLWENVKVGAIAGGATAGITHVVLPLAKGLGTKSGSVFVKNIDKNPVVEHIQVDPQAARSMVIGHDLEKTPAGKEIIKQSVIAEQENKQVAITPSEKGTTTLPSGQKVFIETAPIYDATKGAEVAKARESIKLKDTYASDLEKKSTEELYADPLKYQKQYAKKFGNVANTDLARHLRPEYNGVNKQDVHNFSASVKDMHFNKLLEEGKNRTDSNNTVLFTGGNPGSGKSTIVNELTPKERDAYVAISDTTLSSNTQIPDIQRVLDKGYNVAIHYTLSDPLAAWKRVIDRSLNKDSIDFRRTVQEGYFLEAAQNSRKNALELYNKFKDNPKFSISFYKNMGGSADFAKTNLDFVKGFKYNVDSLRKEISEYTDKLYKEGRITKDAYESFTTDRQRPVRSGSEVVNKQERTTNESAKQEQAGTGKLKESRAYKRLIDHLEETDPETFAKVKDDPKLLYNTVNQKFDFENAAKIVEDNPDQSYRIAKQMEQAPVGQRWESVNIVLADRALAEKNYGLWKDLEQSRSLAQTRAGQGIVAERGRFNDNSPHKYVQEVLDVRLKKIGQNFKTTSIDTAMKAVGKISNSAKERAIAKIDSVVEKAQKFTAKERTKINFAQKLLDDLTCK